MYAKELTKQYLKRIGITKVTRDGRIFVGEKELKQYESKLDEYLRVLLYDKVLYNYLYPKTKQRNSGEVYVGVHRIVYCWFHNSIPNKYVVDHIDNNKRNNNIDNLQLKTPGENIWKDREHNVYELKCKYRPREYYEQQLEEYILKYEEAKLDKDAKRVHSLRSYISQTKAKLRYWDHYYSDYERN